ncbi:MAG: long-chain fatty acid--CoA ligase [Actinomycetota bacterium]
MGFWLSRRAALSPHRVAIDFEDQTITYRELEDRTIRFGVFLGQASVTKGDRVAILSENRPEYIEAFFACAKLGAVLAPISWRLTEPEMRWQLNDSDPSVLIVSGDYAETAKSIFDGQVLVFDDINRTAVASAEPEGPGDASTWNDPLMILYTSGTTGVPKGAVLTHGNFFWGNLNILVNADFSSDEVSLVFLPMFHIGGWNVNTLPVFLKGGMVVLERSFDPSRTLDLIQSKKVTWLMGVPATYLFMSQQPGFEHADLSSVRTMVVGGAPMPESLLKTYAAKGLNIIQGYGLTELAPNALLLPMQAAASKLGSSGKPYFFTDTRLMDDDGNLVDAPGTAEIVARGPVVMSGYWNRPDATDETIKDGWLHTGDVGRTDEDGFYWIVDRKKDMIITGGENVYPAEIENVLYDHPGVGEAAVIGIPDDRWGEMVHAIVVPTDPAVTKDSIEKHCRERLAPFKVPRSIELRADPLPRTPAGKVKKAELRSPWWEGRSTKI